MCLMLMMMLMMIGVIMHDGECYRHVLWVMAGVSQVRLKEMRQTTVGSDEGADREEGGDGVVARVADVICA